MGHGSSASVCAMRLQGNVEKCILLSRSSVNLKRKWAFFFFWSEKGGFFILNESVENNAKKNVFLSEMKYSKQKWTLFVYFEAKKHLIFLSLQCENNLVEAKWKIGSEKKRKNRIEFLKWTSETHAKGVQFHFISLLSQKIF